MPSRELKAVTRRRAAFIFPDINLCLLAARCRTAILRWRAPTTWDTDRWLRSVAIGVCSGRGVHVFTRIVTHGSLLAYATRCVESPARSAPTNTRRSAGARAGSRWRVKARRAPSAPRHLIPVDGLLMTTSTRRFCCRPAAESLSATGSLRPLPDAESRVEPIPCPARYDFTELARRSDSPWL